VTPLPTPDPTEKAMQPIERVLQTKGRNLYVVSPHDTVLSAVEAMCSARIGALLVMDDDVLCGVFSERDLMTRVVLAQRSPSATMVRDVMTREVICIAHDASMADVMRIVTDRRVRHLPVVDRGRIIGVISIGDLIRWALEEKDLEIDHLQDYVTGRYPG
jgi:CBS domain-containing protein